MIHPPDERAGIPYTQAVGKRLPRNIFSIWRDVCNWIVGNLIGPNNNEKHVCLESAHLTAQP
jgi:hypothetical protein